MNEANIRVLVIQIVNGVTRTAIMMSHQFFELLAEVDMNKDRISFSSFGFLNYNDFIHSYVYIPVHILLRQNYTVTIEQFLPEVNTDILVGRTNIDTICPHIIIPEIAPEN